MRELALAEAESVSGGFEGFAVPFTSGRFIMSGPNWPGGAPGAVAGVVTAWGVGSAIGDSINLYNAEVTGMSLGEAIYRTAHGHGGAIRTGGTRIRVKK